MKILHVVFSLEPGGMENGLVNVARGLDAREFQIHVCCLEQRGRFAERLPQPENVSVLAKCSGFSTRTALALRREIARIRPDLIHSHNLGPLIYSGLATCFGFACPILQGEHAELPPEEQSLRRVLQRRVLYRTCHKVHTVSHALRDQLVMLGFSKEKIAVIVNGVDTLRFMPGYRAAARQGIGLPVDALVLGIVGRFGQFKRHMLLVEVFEQIAPRFPNAHLLVVGGGGPEEQHIEARARQSAAAGRIHFAGFQNDTRPYYQAMNLLVAPSVNEGLSNAVLEAMACGVPVLANRACGSTEAIDNGINGYIADLDSVENLREYLRLALSDPLHLTELGASARRKMTTSFSIDQMVAGYEQIYRQIADKLH